MSIVINNRPIGATEMVENPEINIETASFTAVDYNEATKVLTVDPDETHSFVDGNLYKFVVDVNEFEIDVATKIHFTSPDETIEDVYGHYNSVEDAYVFYGMYDDQNNIEMRESVDRVVRLLAPSEIIAGNGLTKSGNTIKVNPKQSFVDTERDPWYEGLVPRVSGVNADGSPQWSEYFTSVDPVAYAGVMRNGNGGINGMQNKLYVHEGTLSATYNGESHTVYYRAISTKSTAFTSRDELYTTTPVNRAVPYEATGETDVLVTVRVGAGGHIRIATFGTNAKETGCQALVFGSDVVTGELV